MKTLAVLVLAAMPLFADVVIPENERPDPPSASTDTATTSAPSTDTASVAPTQARKRAWPVVWLSTVGIAMVIVIAARRRKARLAQ